MSVVCIRMGAVLSEMIYPRAFSWVSEGQEENLGSSLAIALSTGLVIQALEILATLWFYAIDS